MACLISSIDFPHVLVFAQPVIPMSVRSDFYTKNDSSSSHSMYSLPPFNETVHL